jgi:radical SAM superfamily enzyme YgiQ (UPF0313 family)
MRNLIPDLDNVPFADRELISKYRAYRKFHRRYILTGRGCPYNCSYCFNHSYNRLCRGKGKTIRKRSIKNVIEELKLIKKNNAPKRFIFVDDTFILDRKWTLDFCRAYKDEVKLPFIAYLRVNLVDEELVRALKDAGCITVLYAVESGNEHIRNDILKRNISEKQIIEASRLFRKYKLKTYVQNMVGLPDETLEQAFETLALNVKCRPSYAWVSIFQPYPKTELCEYSKKKGYYNGDVDSFEESYYNKSVMRMKDIKKIERLHHLFSIGVAFPFLIPIIKMLIRLPLNPLYLALWQIHRAWCYFFKVRWIDFTEILV